MRFEKFEPRIVFDASLGDTVEFEIDTTVEQAPTTPTPEVPQLPTDIQFRETDDDFVYESENLDQAFIDQLVSTTEAWEDSPATARQVSLSDTDVWRKTINTYPPTFHPDGYFIAERHIDYFDKHTLLYATKRGSDDYALGGTYMKQDNHYRVSFDIRHPESELEWLQKEHWAVVTQFWGPRESGETARNPPFAIYTQSYDGVPTWVIRNKGDSRRITQTGEHEEYRVATIPMENIGEWNTWDIEFVPNPFGDGLVRTWLNGELVAEWVDVKSNYFSILGGTEVGPLNPSFGLYSSRVADGMVAHFDNIRIESNGEFESSISGRVTGNVDLDDATVFATNAATGQRYGTVTHHSGVYSLAVPKGIYTLTAVNNVTGRQVNVHNVDTRSTSKSVNVDVYDEPVVVVPPPALLTTTGDLNGDGKSDIINRLADGSWQVTLVGADTAVTSQERASRAPVTEAPTTETPTETPTTETPNVDPGIEVVVETPEVIDVSPGGEPPVEAPASPFVGETSIWTTWSTEYAWTDIQVADFNGDGLDDIAGRANSGQWWIAESTGKGFRNKLWGTWTPGIEWLDVSVGDFNGDGRADIAGRAATNASWWIAMSEGDSFTNETWGRWTPGIPWQTVSVGDYNGDGLSDIAGRAGTDGTWWISQSDGQRFHNSYWGRFMIDVDWDNIQVGDFNGDGRSDIIARATSDGTLWIAESTGSSFQNSYFGRLNSNFAWHDVSVADVDGDGMDDLVGRADLDGSWWVARSDGDEGQMEFWGAIWETDMDWIASAIADFDGDGKADLMGANSEKWLLSR